MRTRLELVVATAQGERSSRRLARKERGAGIEKRKSICSRFERFVIVARRRRSREEDKDSGRGVLALLASCAGSRSEISQRRRRGEGKIAGGERKTAPVSRY